jgi:DNA-binding transcriptional regulator YiaG
LVSKQNLLQEKANETAVAEGAKVKSRISSKTIRAMRKKLGLSQDSFAMLLGVSGQAVYVMEHRNRRLKLRSGTMARLLALKGIGKREAKRRIEEMETAARKPRAKKTARKK